MFFRNAHHVFVASPSFVHRCPAAEEGEVEVVPDELALVKVLLVHLDPLYPLHRLDQQLQMLGRCNRLATQQDLEECDDVSLVRLVIPLEIRASRHLL